MFGTVIRWRIRRNLFLAVVFAALGIAWLSYLGPSHSACSSALVSSLNQSACQGDAARWYVAWGLLLVGATFGVLAVIGYVKNDEAPSQLQHCHTCGTTAPTSANHCANCGAPLATVEDL